MTQLTKQAFEQILDDKLAPLATKADVHREVRDGVAELAGMVKAGFDGVDQQLAAIVKLLDVRKDVDALKLQMQEIQQALNLKH